MIELKLEDIVLTLTTEKEGVRIKYQNRELLLLDQEITSMSEIVTENFWYVRSRYVSKIPHELNNYVDTSDINHISISIIFHYMYLYYSWRGPREKQKSEWRFNDKYFDQPSTHDFIFDYYHSKYPSRWEEPCATLIGIRVSEISKYLKNLKSSKEK